MKKFISGLTNLNKKALLIIGVLLVIIILLVVIVTMGPSKHKQEEIMKDYATDYYNTYMKKVKGLDIAEVNLDMLKKVNEQDLKDYDLKKLKGCKDTSVVKMHLSKENKITKYEFDLKCK